MMQEIESMFPGVKEFTLDTPDWNIRTNSFYTKLGYTEIKRDSGFVYYAKRNLTENMIRWAEGKLGSSAYAGWCLAFIEDALEISNHICAAGWSIASAGRRCTFVAPRIEKADSITTITARSIAGPRWSG